MNISYVQKHMNKDSAERRPVKTHNVQVQENIPKFSFPNHLGCRNYVEHIYVS